MPSWFPWIFVGGILFIALSFIGAKFKDKQYRNIQFLQDFISGAILIGFIGVLAPDLFPKMEIPVALPTSIGGGFGEMSEFDLQVGPPRLAGR
jgi:hypothetical protein